MNEATRTKVGARLKRTKGQLAGVERMVEEDRCCVDVLVQIAAVRAALAKAAALILEDHVTTCVTKAVRGGDVARRKATTDELLDVFHRYCGS